MYQKKNNSKLCHTIRKENTQNLQNETKRKIKFKSQEVKTHLNVNCEYTSLECNSEIINVTTKKKHLK